MVIKLEGVQQLLNELQAKARNINGNQALRAGAEVARQAIVDEAPKDTGTAAKNIIVSDVVNGKVEIGTNDKSFYLMFHEWGTSKMSARPFLEPAFRNNLDQIQKAMADELRKELGL